MRTQRILRVLLKEGQERGEIRKREDTPTTIPSTAKTLGVIGLNKKQSSTFQQIASIPQETFENFIQEKKEALAG